MIRRFQIEDLVAQDASGVVFRAVDLETGLPVAVRRFFPFGVNGGGLSPDEQVDYRTAVECLAKIQHPAMRAIVCGGCDPVDGMPFIATEWIEGCSIEAYLEQGPLAPAETIFLISQALEVSAEISRVFGQEAVWVETDFHTIIVGAEGTGRGITFWMAPLKWLGKNDGQRGLDAIVSLTEDATGWRGKHVLDSEGDGLGGWLNWLRSAARKATLSEVQEMLGGISHISAPIPVKRVIRPATPAAPIKPPKRKSSLTFVLSGLAVLVAISLGGWALIQWNNSRLAVLPTMESLDVAKTGPKATTSSPQPLPTDADAAKVEELLAQAPPPRSAKRTPEQISQAAAELLVSAQKSDEAKAMETAARNAKIAERKGIFTPADSELLLAMEGEEVTVKGTLAGFKYSNTKATQYLVFSDNPANGEVRGSVLLRTAPAALKEDQLRSLKGKKISLRGKIRIERFSKTPEISIQTRDVIQEIQ